MKTLKFQDFISDLLEDLEHYRNLSNIPLLVETHSAARLFNDKQALFISAWFWFKTFTTTGDVVHLHVQNPKFQQKSQNVGPYITCISMKGWKIDIKNLNSKFLTIQVFFMRLPNSIVTLQKSVIFMWQLEMTAL